MIYLDESKARVNAFSNDVRSLIDNGTQVKGTYRTMQGIHVYNPSTKQWVFISADGIFNTSFRLSERQYKYSIETEVVK